MDDFLAGGEFSSGAGTGGDIDFDKAASAFPDISLDGEGDFPAASANAASSGPPGGFAFDDFDERETDVKVTGDDEIEKFEDQFPDIDVPSQQPTYTQPALNSQPSFGATPTFAPRPQASAYSSTPILNHSIEEDEPQVIKDWREKQAEEIKARDEASKAKRQETIGRAERAIDEFYEDYSKKRERTIRENKEEEQAYLDNMSSALTAGTTWERIADLVELQNSQSKTIARTGAGTTDLARYKEVLLRLKREGTAAPGAAGY